MKCAIEHTCSGNYVIRVHKPGAHFHAFYMPVVIGSGAM